MTEPDYLKMILFQGFWAKDAQNRPKMRFFEYNEKSAFESVQIFHIKLQQHKNIKLTYIIFWQKSCFVFGPELAKMGPK